MYKLIFRSFFCLLLFFVAGTAQAQVTNVLFIGNSYTAYNNLPKLVKDVALSAGDTFYVESLTPGGARFSSHAATPQVYDLIRSRNWNYVVLQGQSQEPSWPDGQVASDVFPYAKQLCDSIRSINNCTIPLFYMTWGRKNGDAQNCVNWPPVCTYQGMDSILYSNYQKMGDDNYAEVSPVGAVWNRLRTTVPSLELYSPDQSHPSLKGSIAAAFTFYSVISRKNPTVINYSSTLTSAEKDSIISAVKAIYSQNQSTYNSRINDANASFELSRQGCTYQALALPNQGSYNWDFGDGSYATTKDVSHTYNQDGDYLMCLAVQKCGAADTFCFTVRCGAGSIQNKGVIDNLVYPNPSHGIIQVSEGFDIISVKNTMGQELNVKDLGANTFNIENNTFGMVFIELQNQAGERVVQKIMLE